jgi:hypothetical protein
VFQYVSEDYDCWPYFTTESYFLNITAYFVYGGCTSAQVVEVLSGDEAHFYG